MSLRLAIMLAALSGYLSLSAEILWVRVVSNAWEGRPYAFAVVLGSYLCGIALGAWYGKRVTEGDRDPVAAVAMMFVAAGLATYVLPPLSATVHTLSSTGGLLAMFVSAAVVAALFGGVLPVACHFGVADRGAAGRGVSWVYAASVAGATAGPLITGFWLLNIDTLQFNLLLVAVLAVFGGKILLLRKDQLRRTNAADNAGTVAGTERTTLAVTLLTTTALVGMLVLYTPMYANLLLKLHDAEDYSADTPYSFMLQNRAGNVGVGDTGIVYGNGVYDGRFNLDPVVDSNWIQRAYLLPALHPHPADILMIGLGSGSWARVLANHQQVESVTVVEINPGYVEAIKQSPLVLTLINDPKVSLITDDGRRWLRRHPDRYFDAVVMNTTYHWRSNASQLLSEEFMHLVRSRLRRGGISYFNSTSSEDAVYTAAQVFAHVVQYRNFVAASDTPFTLSHEQRREQLLAFTQDGEALFDKPAARTVLEKLANLSLPDLAPKLRKRTDLWLITDDNLATEYKTNGPGVWWKSLRDRLYDPARAWHRM